ncbi:MAG: oligosaccharide flippase family protein [Deltaproteobacteria bacterium]|nr:oligosaccharide flippase family protein [Deltaproteobacteria bacterium]
MSTMTKGNAAHASGWPVLALAQRLFSNIRMSLTSRMGQAAQLVILGQVLNGMLGFGINVLMIRRLSIDDYGLFSLFNSTMILLTGFMHFGWLETFVLFAARYRESEHLKLLRQVVFNKIMFFSLLFTAATFLFSPLLIWKIYHRPNFLPFLLAAAVGAWTSTLFNFTMIYHRALEKFGEYFRGQVLATLVRVMLCVFLIPLGYFNLSWVAAVYVFAPLLFCGPALQPARNIFKVRPRRLNPKVYQELYDYNKWIVAASILFMLTGNINAQILAKYHDNASLSDFGVISRLTLPIYFVLAGITTTALPRLSASPEHAMIKNYLRRLMEFLIPAAIVIAVLGWYSPPVVNWIAGAKYGNLATLFRLQVAVVLLTFLSSPVALILSAWGRSRTLLFLNITQLAVNIVAGFWWIPVYGARGAVLVNLAVNAVGLVLVYALVAYELKFGRSRRARRAKTAVPRD